MLYILKCLTALWLVAGTEAALFTLPSERAASAAWATAGISNGVPALTPFCDVTVGIPGTNLVADATGVANAFSALSAAIALCPAGQYVGIGISNAAPQVTLLVSNVGSATMLGNKSDVEVRGKGMQSSILRMRGSAQFVWAYSPSLFRTNLIYDADGVDPVLAQGVTNISLQLTPTPNVTDISVGSYILIDQLMDGSAADPSSTNSSRLNNFLINAQGNEGNWGISAGVLSGQGTNRVHMQVALVTAKTGTNITIWPPISLPLTNALSPRVWYWQNNFLYRRFGLRDLSLDATGSTASAVVSLSRVASWWLYNVEIYGWQRDAVLALASADGTITHCYMHDSTGLTSSLGYGIHTQTAFDHNLIEDNIFLRIRTPIVQEGGWHNVWAYNVLDNFVNALGDTTLQKTPSTHACYPAFNLWEGVIGGRFGADNVHGNSGFNTYFRCWMKGHPGNTTLTSYNWAFTLNRCDLFYSVINSVMQVPGVTGTYEWLAPAAGRSASVKGVFDLGYTSDGFTDYNTGTPHEGINYNFTCYIHDTNVWGAAISAGKLIRQGVYDHITSSVHNDSTYGSRTYDTSLYRSTIPNWWVNVPISTSAFPSFGGDPLSTNLMPAVVRRSYIESLGNYSYPLITNISVVITGKVRLQGAVNLRTQ